MDRTNAIALLNATTLGEEIGLGAYSASAAYKLANGDIHAGTPNLPAEIVEAIRVVGELGWDDVDHEDEGGQGGPPDLEEVRAEAEGDLRSWDRDAAPGSETPLLGPALDNLRAAETPEAIDEALDWWSLAYEAVDTWPHPVTWEELLELGVDSDAALSRARGRAAAAYMAEVRSDLGLTLDHLSAHLSVDRSTIHRWETDASLPQHPGMLRLAMERLAQKGGG